MNIAIVGTGYVGLVSGACFADFGHIVTCVDTDRARIARLQCGELPFYEPGLAELVQRNLEFGRLHFSTDLAGALDGRLVVVLAVGTPNGHNGEADLSQIESAAAAIGSCLTEYCVIVTKSTVPIGTGARLRGIIAARSSRPVPFDVVSNPEFLREGSAVSDFLRPDRVVIGTTSGRAATIMHELYRPLYLIETPVVLTDVETAEMIKYASNAFLAVRIGFMNEIANLCDLVGADVHVVAKGMGLDKRIGPKFLHPGPGYGGSCFPKDTHALAALGDRHGCRQRIVETAIAVNERQRDLVVGKIDRVLDGLSGREIAVLGLAFKPGTSDVRESPAIHVCRRLAESGARIRAFDPVATADAARVLSDVAPQMTYAAQIDEAAAGADALVIMTEWNEFRNLDLVRLKPLMRRAIVVDTRNVLDPSAVRALGFTYRCTGRESVGLPLGPAGVADPGDTVDRRLSHLQSYGVPISSQTAIAR